MRSTVLLNLLLRSAAAAVASMPGAHLALAQAPPTVTVSAPLQKEIVEWDEFTGQFAAVDYVEIRARVSGYLTEIHFQDGQMVKQGDLLFVIDPRPYEATLAAARAQLGQASAQIDLAQRQLERSAELRKKDFEPASSYDQRVSELKVATAAGEAAKAAIRLAELNVEFTRITAPVTGRISNHLVSIGNLVSGGEGNGTTLLTTVVSLDPIYFNFDMSEGDFLAYQRATEKGLLRSTRDNSVPVALHLTDEKGWPHEGKLNFVDNQVDRSSGTIRVRAAFPNSDFSLTPGQFGRIRIPGSEPYQAILVPDAAVVTDQSRKIVMTVLDDGTVKPKVVRTGPTYDNLRIIRSGLEPNDRIVIDGLVRARPGAKVTPQPGKIDLEAQAN
ncbi:MAG TPA: efflux RND transporter periplasmic adaptor subunit [Stellaceae bacterium]|nr:efflux RND transporter periplasmic adaptor subunit [Stellaceae bacterium]